MSSSSSRAAAALDTSDEKSVSTTTTAESRGSTGSTGSLPKPKQKYGKECLCGNGELCMGVAAAFHLLQDPRRGYTKLPKYVPDPQTPEDEEVNLQRAAYIRHLERRKRRDTGERQVELDVENCRDIALHHFHPTVVLRAASNLSTTKRLRSRDFPKTITEEEMTHLEMALGEEDKVLDDEGNFTGEYIFVPSYSMKRAKKDLKRLVKAKRMVAEFAMPASGQSTRDWDKTIREKKAAKAAKKRIDAGLEPIVIPLQLDKDTSMMKPPADPQLRAKQHSLLHAFEDDRREDFAIVFERTSQQWRAAILLLEEGVRDVARAERLVIGAALANQAFSDAMYATHFDCFMDDNGNEVSDPRRQHRLLDERSRLDNAIDIDPNPAADHLIERDLKKTLLTSINQAHSKLSDKFATNARYGTEEVGRDLTIFRQDLEVETRGIDTMGASLLREMQEAERDVQIAWQALHVNAGPEMKQQEDLDEGMFVMTLSGDEHEVKSSTPGPNATAEEKLNALLEPSPMDEIVTSPSSDSKSSGGEPGAEQPTSPLSETSSPSALKFLRRAMPSQQPLSPSSSITSASPSPITLPSSPVAASIRKIQNIKDVWVLESLYRAAARHEARVWEICLRLLSQMHRAVQDMELERNVKLHSLLMDYFPRERRMFLGLPATPQTVLDDLIKLRVDRKAMEQTIEDSISIRSRLVLKQDHQHRSSILNRSRIKSVDALSEDDLAGEAFDSMLMRHVMVLQRRSGAIPGAQWRLSLAVLTADYYLHLFDLQSYPDLDMDSTPEDAWDVLLPSYEMPAVTGDVWRVRETKLLESLTPAESINICNCEVTKNPNEPRHLEVTEVRNKNARRKFTLSTTGEEETLVLLNLMLRRPSQEIAALGDDDEEDDLHSLDGSFRSIEGSPSWLL